MRNSSKATLLHRKPHTSSQHWHIRDQVHEQLNAMVKGDGGVIGITENETALRRWGVAGPETARLLTEYEEKHSKKQKESERHHE